MCSASLMVDGVSLIRKGMKTAEMDKGIAVGAILLYRMSINGLRPLVLSDAKGQNRLPKLDVEGSNPFARYVVTTYPNAI